MNQKLVELFNELINNTELTKEFSKNNNINELYNFCLNISDGYDLKEFTEFLRNIISINSRISNELKEILDNDLLDVAGGFNFRESSRRALSSIMGGMLLFGSVPQTFANSNISNYDSSNNISITQKVDSESKFDINSKIEEIKNNISETAKENLKTLAETAEKCVGAVLDVVTPSVSAVAAQQRVKPTVYSWPTASNIKVGDTVGSSALSGGSASVSGSFMWLPNISGTTVSNAGKSSYICQFVPSDTEHYSKVTQAVSINVISSETRITSQPTASILNYGQKLSECTLYEGSGNVPGSFSWENSSITPNAGTNNYTVVFTPSDRNYSPIKCSIPVTVNKATPTVRGNTTASGIKVGQTLGASNIDVKMNIPGKATWVNPSELLGVGTHKRTIIFTPSDNRNYNTVMIDVSITVSRAVPKVVGGIVTTDINYGQSIGSSRIDLRTDVPGTATWENPYEILSAGQHKRNVIFTPSDLNRYEPITISVALQVNKLTPSIVTPASTAPIIYGASLNEAKILGLTLSVPGKIKWSNPSEKLDAGRHRRTLVFTPDDSRNYNTLNIDVDVTVNKAVARLDKREFSSIYRPGISLKDFKLPRGWAWKDSSIPFNKSGKFEFIAKYREDRNHYETEEAITIKINKAEPSLALKAITYDENQRLGDIKLPKGWHWDNENETPVASKSSYRASYNADEAGTNCYHSRNNIHVELNVNKADPKVEEWPSTVSDVTYGDNLSQVKLQNGKSGVKGTFIISENRNLKVGKHKCTVTFTPNNPNYQTKTGTIYVNIIKNMNPRQACRINSNQISRSDTSIKFNTNEEDLEFSKDGGNTWQDSYEFKNLSPKKEYNFVYRYKETESQCTGKTSSIMKISTKDSAPDAPQELKVRKRARHEIEFESNNLLEFSKDGGHTWQDSSKFENLKGGEKYNFIARYKENEEHVAGKRSNITQVKTRSLVGHIIDKIFRK